MRPGTLLRWFALKNLLKSEIKNGQSIIDIGSYDGAISYNLIRLALNLKVTVIDIDRIGLQLAKKRGLNTICSSALELPVRDRLIDVVICFDVIEHIENDSKLIMEISRILKGDGKVILTTPMQNGVSFPFLSKNKNETINKDWGHVRKGYSLEKIEDMFRNNNLIIEKSRKYFNICSRFGYWFTYFLNSPLKNKDFFYQLLIRLEPYIRYGSEEYVVIGRKVCL